MNVNIGAWQLAQPGYARRVAAVLEAAQWLAGSLEIDVTEASLRADPDAAQANLQALRALGARVVLDASGLEQRARVEAAAQAANDEARFVPVRRPA